MSADKIKMLQRFKRKEEIVTENGGGLLLKKYYKNVKFVIFFLPFIIQKKMLTHSTTFI